MKMDMRNIHTGCALQTSRSAVQVLQSKRSQQASTVLLDACSSSMAKQVRENRSRMGKAC